MKLPITTTYLLPWGLLAFLAMVGCTPTTTGPTPPATGSSDDLVLSHIATTAPVSKTQEQEHAQPTVKPSLPEKVILDGTVLKSVPGGWKLDARGMEALNRAIEKIRSFGPGVTVVLTGYSSSTSTRGKNIFVSRHRAEFVAKILMNLGIAPDKITVRSLGSSNPIADNTTPHGRMKNRRVEIEFQKP